MAKLGYDGKRKEVGGEEQEIGNVKEIRRNKQRLNGVKIKPGDPKKLPILLIENYKILLKR